MVKKLEEYEKRMHTVEEANEEPRGVWFDGSNLPSRRAGGAGAKFDEVGVMGTTRVRNF
jgi:hypothetical protein